MRTDRGVESDVWKGTVRPKLRCMTNGLFLFKLSDFLNFQVTKANANYSFFQSTAVE